MRAMLALHDGCRKQLRFPDCLRPVCSGTAGLPQLIVANPLTTKRVWALALSAAVVVLDRLTKLYIQHGLSPFDNIPVIPDFLRIVHVENPGAAFGVLADGNPAFRGLILIGVSFLVMCLVVAALWIRSVTDEATGQLSCSWGHSGRRGRQSLRPHHAWNGNRLH